MYSWEGMKKINHEEAIELFNNNESVFLLYEDNTKAQAESIEEIKTHCGEFGIEP